MNIPSSELTAETIQRRPLDNYAGLLTVADEAHFPATTWLREFLRYGIRTGALNPSDLARLSPPSGDVKRITGANLARQVARLNNEHPLQSQDWLAHVRTALPDVRKIDSVLRGEDKHRYVVVEYANGVRVPSWMLSEGALRLLALTILAYLPDPAPGVYLVEEPENGVHPTALETIYQSLSSVPNAQVLVASHSPVLLSMAPS
jgi:predicted ATPase